MEVSTVSPSLISPTEGDDPCETDVTNVAIDTVTLIIGLCGLAGNGAVLYLIHMKTHARVIFSLAFIDLFFVLLVVPSALLFLVEDVSCSLIMSPVYLSFLFHLSMVSYYWVLFLQTLAILRAITTFICEHCCHRHLPECLWLMLRLVLFFPFFSLVVVNPTVRSLCPAHEQEHCRAALTSMYALYLLVTVAMLILILIKFIKAKCGSQQQQPRRIDTVIFLIALLTLLLSLWNFLQQFGYIVVSSQVDFLLTCINSSIKPFTYFLVGRCWRHHSIGSLRLSLQRVFEE